MKQLFSLVLTFALISTPAFAQVTIIDDDLNADTSADYTVVTGGQDGNWTMFDGAVDFAFDYSTLLASDGNPIPPAPSTTDGSTTGVHVQVNNSAGIPEAATIFHNTEITGVQDYTMMVDMYMGVWDTASGDGTTEHAHIGVAGDGVTRNHAFSFPGALDQQGSGNYVFISSDGALTSDYRHWRDDANGTGNPGTVNQFDDDYLSPDKGTNVVGANFLFFEGISNGNSAFPGYVGDAWVTVKVEVLQSTGRLNYFVRGQDDVTTGDPTSAPTPPEFVHIIDSPLFDTDGFVNFGLADLYNSVATDPTNQFAIFDNLFVEGTNLPMGGGVDGDFDDNNVYECADIDALILEIAAGTDGASFDLTGDGTVAIADRDAWLVEAGAAELASGSAFFIGDVDLSATVDSTDLGQLLNNFGATMGIAYCGGDLNADSNVDSTDLGLLLNNFGQTAALAVAVPEPETLPTAIFACLLGIATLRRRRR